MSHGASLEKKVALGDDSLFCDRVGWISSSFENLRRDALDVLLRADRYRWIHQTTWMGEPVLNLPQDMFAIQEIIFKTRPKYVVELGVAWGGSLLFYATLLDVLGGGKSHRRRHLHSR